LLDLSRDEDLAELARSLGTLARRAESVGVGWMLIGATARDLILARGYGLRSTRATLDVDIAVCVDGWSVYEALKAAVVEQDGALEDPNRRHRVILPGALQLDLVPFGGVEEDGMVAWPLDSDPRMNVLGLTEVFERPERSP
jgi:predicted nucleotidyltransferase